MPVRAEIDYLHLCSYAMERGGDLLRMGATGLIGVRQDHDVSLREVRRQRCVPFSDEPSDMVVATKSILARLSASFSPSTKKSVVVFGAAISSGSR